MGMTCTVCGSKHRRQVDRALATGATTSDVANRYGVGQDSVQRHRQRCRPDPAVTKAIARTAAKHGVDIYETLIREHAKAEAHEARVNTLVEANPDNPKYWGALQAAMNHTLKAAYLLASYTLHVNAGKPLPR